MEKHLKQEFSAISWQSAVGMTFLWPCLQSSGFYPLSLVPGVEQFGSAPIAQFHFFYSLVLTVFFALAFIGSRQVEAVLRKVRLLPVVIAMVGAVALAVISSSTTMDASPFVMYGALLCSAFAIVFFVLFWGMVFSCDNAKHNALQAAVSYALSQVLTFLVLLAGTPQEWFLCICMVGCGVLAAKAPINGEGGCKLLSKSFKQLPWDIIVFSVLLIYFCVIYIRLQITQFGGDASATVKCFASMLCLIAFSGVAVYLAKEPTSPYRFTVVFIALVGGYLVGLGGISVFSTDGGVLARRVLIADEHCVEAFLWMVLVYHAASKQLSGIKLFALYGIVVVALPWMISFDVRYLTPIGEIVASSNWMLPLVTLALCATALGSLVFLSSYVLRISRNASAVMQQSIRESAETVLSQAGLTPRELEIVAYVYRGYSAKRIAEKLYVSEPTVKSYTSRAYRKLGVKSKQELIDYVDERRPLA